MRLEEAIYARLAGTAPLSALVGDRIFPLLAPPETASPYATYQRIDGASDHVLDDGPSGLGEARVQVDCWSAEREGVDAYSEARRVALAVAGGLDGFRGLVDDGAGGGLRIKSSRLVNNQDLREDDPHIYRTSLDFLISHDEET